MDIDLELYRKEVPVSSPRPDPGARASPPVRLSVIDISPEFPRHTLVFLHGFGGQAAQWQYQLRQFCFANRVIAVDLRGHGRSDKPRGTYSMGEILADLENALAVLGVEGKIVLVGHSFGGAIAAEFANAHPGWVERLVLIATAGEFKLNPLYRLGLRLPLPIAQMIAPIVRSQLSAPLHVLKPWYANNLSKWNGWSLFRSLTLPTLIVRGHLDLVFERPMFEEVTRAIPAAEEADVGASGHMVMLERRAAVNRAIERFLDEAPRSWREAEPAEETTARAALRRERPWLAHYDDGVPFTIAVPRIPLHQLLRSAARRYPRHAAISFEGCRISYHRLNQEANRFANALRALGVSKGDRVLLFLPNLPQMVMAFFGVLKAGAVAVFTLPTTEPDELIRQMQNADIRVMVTLSLFADLARRVMKGVRESAPLQDLSSEAGIAPPLHIVFTNPGDYLCPLKRLLLSLSSKNPELRRAGAPLDAEEYLLHPLLAPYGKTAPDVEVSPDSLAAIMYTGGTTAEAKGVMLSHQNLVANALQTRHWMADAQQGRERFLCVLPFSHSYGLTTALTVPVSLGAMMILKARFDAASVLKAIKRYHPTVFPGVPSMYVAINNFPGVRKYGVRSIRACISGSAPLPVEVQEAFEKLTRGRLVEGYGLTEASPVTHANPLNGLRKVGSIGVPLPSTEARVVDLAHGAKDVPVGQIGELALRGPQVMMGYWQNPEATRSVLTRDGWLLTGDVAQMDEEGYFRIVARKADMWYPTRPGKPAFPRDVEEVLFEVPQVKETAVVAIAGQPVAFVIAKKERPPAESLIAYCKRRLPPELVPKLVIFVDDFPRTFIGKVLRRELAKRYEDKTRGE